MSPVTTPPPPGSMTVPPLFGWGEIMTVLMVVIAVAAAFFVIAAVWATMSRRSEWQAWLDGRSRGRHHPQGRPAEPVRAAPHVVIADPRGNDVPRSL